VKFRDGGKEEKKDEKAKEGWGILACLLQ